VTHFALMCETADQLLMVKAHYVGREALRKSLPHARSRRSCLPENTKQFPG
jgi:hypothetical protein